jgi:MFS family permease
MITSPRQEGCDLVTSANRYFTRVCKLVQQAFSFVRRQPTHWIVSALRSSLAMFLYNIVAPYLSIYTISLGASATQLGIVNSVGMAAAGLVAPFVGWIIDRHGVRRIYLIGIVLLAASYAIYGGAHSWSIAILAMIVYWLGQGFSGQSCSTICGNSIRNEDRATAMSLCETLAAGVLGMLAPLLGAALVIRFGGIHAGGIRPLFFVSLAGTVGTFFLIYFLLPNCSWPSGGSSLGFLRDLRVVFKSGTKLGRWLVIDAIGFLPMGMVVPFAQPFAHELKGASELVLGLMITAFALTPLILGLPIGRIADRIGRKPVLYVTIPLSWLSSVALILAPNSIVLVLSGILLGFFTISAVTAGAMAYELVPRAHMGRWLGLSRFVRMLFVAAAAYFAGRMWDQIGPQYVFLTAIALDVFIRMPLLMTMPETLHLAEPLDPST